MPTFEHCYELSVQSEMLLTRVALVVFACASNHSKFVEDLGVSHGILHNKVCSVKKDVLQVGFSLDLLFESGLEFCVSHVLLAFLLQKIDDSFKAYIFSHFHHECLDSCKQKDFEVVEVFLFGRVGIVVNDVLLDDVNLLNGVKP